MGGASPRVAHAGSTRRLRSIIKYIFIANSVRFSINVIKFNMDNSVRQTNNLPQELADEVV